MTVLVGSVHGRFQSLHNEHMEYILEAKSRCKYLWIGLTQYELTNEAESPGHRQLRSANPLTYAERMAMISRSLQAVGIATSEFGFVPFPIDSPAKLIHFVNPTTVCFTTVCESWNVTKVDILRQHGYEVIVLYEREKSVSSSEIRDSILEGSDEWRKSVPQATSKYLEEIDFRSKLQKLSEE